MGGRYHGFVSYNSQDVEQVKALCQKLLALRPKLRFWIDQADLDYGESVAPELFVNIDKCEHLLAFVGPHGLGPFQKEEINYGLQKAQVEESDFRVIPVFMDDARGPRWLRGYTAVYLTSQNQTPLQKLAEFLLDEGLEQRFGKTVSSDTFSANGLLASVSSSRFIEFLANGHLLFEDPDNVSCSFFYRSVDTPGSTLVCRGSAETVVENARESVFQRTSQVVCRIHLYSTNTDEEVEMTAERDLNDPVATSVNCRVNLSTQATPKMAERIGSLVKIEHKGILWRNGSSGMRRLAEALGLVGIAFVVIGGLSALDGLWDQAGYFLGGIVLLLVGRLVTNAINKRLARADGIAISP